MFDKKVSRRKRKVGRIAGWGRLKNVSLISRKGCGKSKWIRKGRGGEKKMDTY